jgi:hypothetical protein
VPLAVVECHPFLVLGEIIGRDPLLAIPPFRMIVCSQLPGQLGRSGLAAVKVWRRLGLDSAVGFLGKLNLSVGICVVGSQTVSAETFERSRSVPWVLDAIGSRRLVRVFTN